MNSVSHKACNDEVCSAAYACHFSTFLRTVEHVQRCLDRCEVTAVLLAVYIVYNAGLPTGVQHAISMQRPRFFTAAVGRLKQAL
jgi:hypothetical protein